MGFIIEIIRFFALKHWNFKSISTSNYFFVVAIANFNYVANAFVYVIDRKSQDKLFYMYESRSILSQAIKEQANSSIDGCTEFYQSSSEYIRLCYNSKGKSYEINVNVPMKDGHHVSLSSKIEYSKEKHQSLVLVYPVKENRPAYTHKIAGLSARGTIKIDDNLPEEFQDGISSIDWTLGYPERICRWKWISLSTIVNNPSNNESTTVGINLSDLVYNDENGISMENAIWINGQVYTVSKINYVVPEKQYQTIQSWEIYSNEDTSPKIRLSFQPLGSQEEHLNVFLLAGDFVQVFGIYSGTIEVSDQTYVIENSFGVAENHYAKW